MSGTRRALLGLLSFVPAAGVLAIAITSTALQDGDRLVMVGGSLVRVPGLTEAQAIAFGIAVVLLAFVQMGVAIPFVLHTRTNDRLSDGQRILWALLVVFVGSIFAPIYWGSHVRRISARPQ